MASSNPPGYRPTFLPDFSNFLKLLLEAGSIPHSFKIRPQKGKRIITIVDNPVKLQNSGTYGIFIEHPSAKA